MGNDYLSPITAPVKQDSTAFTNKENIKAGAVSNGTNHQATCWQMVGKFQLQYLF